MRPNENVLEACNYFILKNFMREPPPSVTQPFFLHFSVWFHHKMMEPIIL